MFTAIPGEYDDYITNKKRSGYQSLHTAVTGPDGALLEFQVRTRAMHEAAEFGDAAHWLYKDFINAVQPQNRSVPEEVGAVAAGVAEAAASATAETNPFERASVGQPVQIVWDAATGPGGGRLSAGVVCYAEGSRIHVVEPRRGDAFAPGLASTGLAETAEWVAMGLHKDALDRAIRAKRVEPRQSGPGYLVLEFALCSDGRWHKCDAFGRKLATTAELLDEDALLAALETAAANEVEDASANPMECAEDDVECVEMAVALEAEEVIAAFDQKAEEVAAAAAAGETLTRGSFFAPASSSFEMSSDGEASRINGGANTAVLQTSPDDEMAAARVRAMQAVLKAYLSDSPTAYLDAPFPDGFDSFDDEDDPDDKTNYPYDGSGSSRNEPSLILDASRDTLEPPRGTEDAETDSRAPPMSNAVSTVEKASPARKKRWSANLTVEQALAQAREDLKDSAARAGEAAKATRRRARRARKEAEWRSGEVESPIFAIAQAGVAKEVKEPADGASPIFSADAAAELQAAIGDAMRKTRSSQGATRETLNPSISVNDESVMVITWTRTDEASAMQPELVRMPKGATASQLVAGELAEGEVDGTVNVNGEEVKPDTELKPGDMLFLE